MSRYDPRHHRSLRIASWPVCLSDIDDADQQAALPIEDARFEEGLVHHE